MAILETCCLLDPEGGNDEETLFKDGNGKIEDRRQKSEDRGQETEDRGQETEVRRQESEDRRFIRVNQ